MGGDLSLIEMGAARVMMDKPKNVTAKLVRPYGWMGTRIYIELIMNKPGKKQ